MWAISTKTNIDSTTCRHRFTQKHISSILYTNQYYDKINKIREFWLFNQHSSAKIIENAIESFESMFISIRILSFHEANLQNCLQINNNKTFFESFEQRQRALSFILKNIWWRENEIFFCSWENEHRRNCKTIFSKKS
jgi:hypothetical protein